MLNGFQTTPLKVVKIVNNALNTRSKRCLVSNCGSSSNLASFSISSLDARSVCSFLRKTCAFIVSGNTKGSTFMTSGTGGRVETDGTDGAGVLGADGEGVIGRVIFSRVRRT